MMAKTLAMRLDDETYIFMTAADHCKEAYH
jgi:hypothetical protein